MKKKFIDRHEEVIKRWTKIKVNKKLKKLKPYFDLFFIFKLRITLKFKQKKELKALDDAILSNVKQLEKINLKNFEAMYSLFNIGLFFLIAERDLQSLKIDALTHHDMWKRKLSLRFMLLIIYERDMSKVASGKTMQTIYLDAQISDETKNIVKDALRDIAKAQKKAQFVLKDIRNETTAHRDSNSLLQYKKIDSLNIFEYEDLLDLYYKASSKLTEILPIIIKESGELKSLVSQYGKYKDKSK